MFPGWRSCVPALLLLAGCGAGADGPDTVSPAGDSPAGDADVRPEPVSLDWAAFATPTPEFRPWVRWWWPGGDVEDTELARQLGVLANAWIGGAEIQAFDAALDPGAPGDELARRRSFGTPAFQAHVLAALAAGDAAELEMGLTLGSGWPMGGDHVAASESLKTLLTSEHRVSGPGPVTIPLPGPDLAPFYQIAEAAAGLGEPLARYVPDEATLVAVVAGRVVGGSRADNPLVLTDVLELEPGTLTVLTDLVEGDGLTWDKPAGDWVVVAFWALPDGEFVSLEACPEEAWVTDPLRADRVEASLEHLVGFAAGAPALTDLFTDSFEHKAERLWTDDLPAEFAARRGYDIHPWLPVVMTPGADNFIFDGAAIPRKAPWSTGPGDARIRRDWQRTVSELFIERYVKTCAAWAEARGLRSRIQAYGLDLDVIAASAASHVPEAEQLFAGGSTVLLKAVAAGAWIGGREVVSAESLVWAGRDHMLTPTKLLASAHKLFASGVTRLTYHGFPYRKLQGYGAQGWHPFSSPWSGLGTYSSNVGESNPYWGLLSQVNRYLARLQWLLRQGRPEVDVAVVLPFVGVTAALGRLDDWDEVLYRGSFPGEPADDRNALYDLVDSILGPADPGPAVAWLRAVRPLLETLEAAGFTWTWVNDDTLAGATTSGTGVRLGALEVRAVLVADAPWMDAAAAEALATAAAAGAVVRVVGAPPAEVPGRDTGGLDARVMAAFEGIPALGDDPAAALAAAGVVPVAAVAGPPTAHGRMVRRIGPGAHALFLWNPTPGDLPLSLAATGCSEALWVDPMAGTWAPANGAPRERALPPWGAVVLTCGLPPPAPWDGWAEAPAPWNGTDHPVLAWTLTVAGADVAGGAVSLPADELPDWRDVEALRHASTPGTYAAVVDLPEVPAAALLRLGHVDGVATVRVNGLDAGTALVPPFEVEVTGLLAPGENALEVTVIPPLRNRLVGLGISGDPSYVQYDRPETLVPVGLRGPVTLLY